MNTEGLHRRRGLSGLNAWRGDRVPYEGDYGLTRLHVDYAVSPISWVPRSRGLLDIVPGWLKSETWLNSSRFTQR
jgi:hypothetical protein